MSGEQPTAAAGNNDDNSNNSSNSDPNHLHESAGTASFVRDPQAAAAAAPPRSNSNTQQARAASSLHAVLSRLVRGDTSDVEAAAGGNSAAAPATTTTTSNATTTRSTSNAAPATALDLDDESAAAAGANEGGGDVGGAAAETAAAAAGLRAATTAAVAAVVGARGASNNAAAAAATAAPAVRFVRRSRSGNLAATRGGTSSTNSNNNAAAWRPTTLGNLNAFWPPLRHRRSTAATGVVSLDQSNNNNIGNGSNNNNNNINGNSAPQQQQQQPHQQQQQHQHRVVRRVRVPRGAHMNITIGRSPAHQQQAPAHLSVPVADLQPEVLREQEMRTDRTEATTATTTTSPNTIANIKQEVMSTSPSNLTNGIVVETVNNEDETSGGSETMETDETSSVDEDQRKPAATEGDSNSNREETLRTNSQQQQEDDLHHHQYKCPICYDYLDQPVGCGQCSGRFCATCLQQVLQPRQQQSGVNGNTNQARCPTCRSPFTAAVPDADLAFQMTKISIPCPYAACSRDGTSMIPLSEYKTHEASCPGVRVACRYAPYGCEWKGYRSELAAHEASDCVLAQIPTLLEQFRTVQANHLREVNSMQQQTAFLLNSMSAMESTLQNAMMYHRSNPLHLVAFATTATTTTVRLLSNKAVWKQMYHSEAARANVFNTFALLPTVLLVMKTVAEGIRLHCRAWTWDKVVLLWQSPEESSKYWGWSFSFWGWAAMAEQMTNDDATVASSSDEELAVANYLLHHLFMTWHVGLLGVLLLLCFYADDSSTTWKIEIQHILRSPTTITPAPRWRSIKIIQCIAYIATCSLYYFILELHGTMVGSLAVAFAIVGGMVLPCSLSKIMHLLATDDSSTANPNPNEDALTFILYKCRATRPLFIGIQCGLGVSAFGLMTCLNACLLSSMILFAFRGRVVGAQYGKLLTQFSVGAGVIATNAFNASEGEQWLAFLNVVCMSLACALQFLAVTVLFYCSLQVGTRLGESAYARAKRGAASGVLGLRLEHESVVAGVVAFSIWVTSLFLLVVTLR